MHQEGGLGQKMIRQGEKNKISYFLGPFILIDVFALARAARSIPVGSSLNSIPLINNVSSSSSVLLSERSIAL